jgi:hypothetical protein
MECRLLGAKRTLAKAGIALIFLDACRANAQTAARMSGKPDQARPSALMGCKLVGTVKGIKIWAGDFVATPELRGVTPSAEPNAPAPSPEANPAAKQ